MPHPALVAGNVALITGAASGIGLSLARLLASRGLHLLLADIAPIPTTSSTLFPTTTPSPPVKVETMKTDVSSLEDWHRLRAFAAEKFPRGVDVLVLNAGTSAKTPWDDVDAWRKVWGVNFGGVLNGVATFLPGMREARGGGEGKGRAGAVIITGSKQGITNPPGPQPGYNVSKSAVKTLAEQLSYDLASTAPSISVHLLVPGWTHTGLTGAGAGKEKPAGAWAPEQVVEYLLKKMDDVEGEGEGEGRGRGFYVICPDNETAEEVDRKRVLWAAGDIVEGRPPLSRWRGGVWGEKFKAFMES